MKTNRFDDEDDGGAWRERLAHWTAPEPPPRLEQRLRAEVQRRHRQRQWRLWGGRAAAALFIGATALALRFGGGAAKSSTARGPAAGTHRAAAMAVVDNEVHAEVDLAGFVPVRRLQIARLEPVVSETDLEGFVPMRVLKLTTVDTRGGPR